MNSDSPQDIGALIDASPLGRTQILILTLLGSAVLMDGFDVMAMAFVAPALIHDWGIEKSALGPVFGAGLFGMFLGSLALSWLADKIGRKPVLILSSLFFAAFSFATVLATSVDQLMLIRFVAGLGLGGIMPNATALAGELSPKRHRVALTMFVSTGFTVGAAVGGLLAAAMIPAWGWHSVFWVGGALPIVIALLIHLFVPESLHFSLLKGGGQANVVRWLRRIVPGAAVDAEARFALPEGGHAAAPIAELFRHGRAVGTMLLWAIHFMNLLVLYFLSDWIPTIAHAAGLTLTQSVLLGTSLLTGGIVGAIVMGPAIDRIGFAKVLVPAYFAQALLIALIGQSGGSLPLMFVVVALAGFCIYGGQPGVIALSAESYPTALRSTGIGWSLGAGRVGSIIGPVVGGMLIHLNWSAGALFVAAAVPALLSAGLILWFTGRAAASRSAARPAGDAAAQAPEPARAM